MLELSKRTKRRLNICMQSCTNTFILAYVQVLSFTQRMSAYTVKQPDILCSDTTGSVFRHTDSQFNLRLSGWEMKGLTNLLLWADSLNGCHKFISPHARVRHICGRESLANREGNSRSFGFTPQRENQTLLWGWFGSGRGTWASSLFEARLSERSLSCFSELSEGAAYSSIDHRSQRGFGSDVNFQPWQQVWLFKFNIRVLWKRCYKHSPGGCRGENQF